MPMNPWTWSLADMTMTSARWAVASIGAGLSAGLAAQATAADAPPARECFGGPVAAVVTGEKHATQVSVVGDSLFWFADGCVRRMPLAGKATSTVAMPGDLDIK